MLRTLKLLLLEDDTEDALLFQRRCPPTYRVHHVTTLDAALRALREQEFDLCFADYRLGAHTGLDLVRSLRREGQRVPVVLITGQDIDALGENALLAGAIDYMPKNDLYARAIDKVCRRALIRRHADSQRDALAAPEMIAALLGQAPTATRAAAQDERRLLYVSRARRTFAAQELLLMCGRFAQANAMLNVTGVLAHVGNRFLQVLEGQREALDALLARIQADPRHGELAVLLDEPAPTRLFAQWAMGCLHADVRYDGATSDATALGARLSRLLGPSGLTRENLAQLLHSLPALLGGAVPAQPGISSSSFSGGTAG